MPEIGYRYKPLYVLMITPQLLLKETHYFVASYRQSPLVLFSMPDFGSSMQCRSTVFRGGKFRYRLIFVTIAGASSYYTILENVTVVGRGGFKVKIGLNK